MRILTLVFILGLCLGSYGGITVVDNQVPHAKFMGWRYVAVTARDTIFGTATPYFKMDFKTESVDSEPQLSMVLFHSDRKQFIGRGSSWCCNEQLYQSGKCDKPGELNIRNKEALGFTTALSEKYMVDSEMKTYLWPSLSPYGVTATKTGSVVNVLETLEVEPTGTWYFVLANCALTNSTEYVVGEFEWKNPFGYLSGSMFANLPIDLSLAGAYFGLLIVWIVFVAYYKKDLMGLQHFITVAVVIGFIEALLWAIYFTSYNYDGHVIPVMNVLGAILDALKVSVVRTLILLVALGYSITRADLSTSHLIGVSAITTLYFITEAAMQYINLGRSIGMQIPEFFDHVILASISSLNILYIVWIGYSLNGIMVYLRHKNQLEKLALYKIFAAALLLFLGLSILCFILQTTFAWAGYHDDLWHFWWVWDAYWEFSYVSLTLLIAYLWRPNSNNKRYAYSLQIADGEDGLDEMSGDVELKGSVDTATDEERDSTGEDEANQDGYNSDQLEQLHL